MFYLKPRIHFHEPDAVSAQPFRGICDKLDGACTDIIDCFGRFDRCRAEPLACRLFHARRRGFLNYLLVPALQRAIAFEQVDDVAMGVAEYLHFDMARPLDVFLDQDMCIAERGGRFALATGERIDELSCLVDLAHSLAAAASDGLDQHGVADLCRAFSEECRVLVFAHIAGGDGNARFGHQFLGCVLQPHRGNAGRVWPDPDQPSVDHGLRKLGVFGQEAIARMNSVCASSLCSGDDLLAHQIALTRRGRADMYRLIRLAHMQRLRISIRIYRNCANTHGTRGADDPTGNLATIGDQEGFDHVDHIRNTPKRGASSTAAFSAAAKARPSTSRVCAGSMMPSSHRRDVA